LPVVYHYQLVAKRSGTAEAAVFEREHGDPVCVRRTGRQRTGRRCGAKTPFATGSQLMRAGRPCRGDHVMGKRFAAVAFVSFLTLPAYGQNGADGTMAARSDDPPTASPSRAVVASAEPHVLAPGHYVYAAPYGPGYWSPHLRPFPGYGSLRRSGGLPRRSLNYRFGRFGGYPSYCVSPYPSYGCSYGSCGGEVEAAYKQGRFDADREYLWYIASQRAGRLINQHAEKFDAGVRLFREGRYEEALINLMGAAEADQSRSAPRLHAGHAMFALGRYAAAVDMIARAFELSPGLPYKTYDIREEYGERGDFDKHLARLRRRVAARPNDAAAVTLLAYVTYYTDGPSAARPLLARARGLDADSYFIPKLLGVADAAGAADAEEDAPSRRKAIERAKPSARSSGPRIVRITRPD